MRWLCCYSPYSQIEIYWTKLYGMTIATKTRNCVQLSFANADRRFEFLFRFHKFQIISTQKKITNSDENKKRINWSNIYFSLIKFKPSPLSRCSMFIHDENKTKYSQVCSKRKQKPRCETLHIFFGVVAVILRHFICSFNSNDDDEGYVETRKKNWINNPCTESPCNLIYCHENYQMIT